MKATPVTVLTGFLGSGKTTLLNILLQRPELKQTAVLINEFGEIGLDHLLVQKVDENIVMLSSGCLCCTVRGDMVDSLHDLYLKRAKQEIPDFTRVVIETTGLADPAPIVHTLTNDPLLALHYRLDGLVATVDAVTADRTLNNHMEAVKQVAMADRLVITKADLADPVALEQLRTRLHGLNPGAPQIIAQHGVVDPRAILEAGLFNDRDKIPNVRQWLNAEAYQTQNSSGHHHDHHHDVNRHDARVQAFVFVHDRPISLPALSFALEMLAQQKGENLLRVKGILNVKGEDKPYALHGVQHVFHPPAPLDDWPDDDHKSRIVFIVRDMERGIIAELLTEIFALADEKGV